MKKKFMVCAMLTMLLGMSLVSCNDDIDTLGGYVPGEFRYSLCVPNANDEMLVVLDSLSSPVKSIGTCPDWAVATVAESTADGHPVVRLVTKDCGPDVMNEGEIVILSEQNDRVTLALTQSVYVAGNENSSDEFMTDWENQQSVTIYSERAHQQIPTPWADASITTLPEAVRYDVKKKDGWEMAFSFLNNESFDDCNYFALYNRYLGTLRIFLYVTNSTTNASEYSFEVDMGSNNNKKNKAPFYHALAYAIPSNHTSIPNNVNLLGNGISSQFTFKSFFSPYRSVSSTVLSKGWTAFDIDVSAYSPSETNWLESGEQMQISCRTVQNQAVSLAGNISANISGKYSSAEQTVSASGGVSSLLSTAGSVIGDVQNSSLAAIEKQVTGASLDMYCYYAGAACNVAAFAYDYLMSNKYEESVTDSMPGKIEMSMTGDIDLSGYITSLTSNGIKPVTLKGSIIKNTNTDSHFGQGIWSIVADPVIYVIEDRFMGDVSRFNLITNKNGSYGNPYLEEYHLRMISFLDPTNICVQINEDIFPDLSDVSVTLDYGVYPDIDKGHTQRYASLLGLNRPKLKIINEKISANIYYSYKAYNNCMKYIQAPRTDFMSKVLGETSGNCKVVKQAGGDYSYYGKVVDCEGKNFIMQPQVYFPVTNTESGVLLYDGEIPDFVVLVNLTFKSNGRTYVFSQRFLPEIKLIKSDEAKSKLKELKAYKTTCEQNGTINYLQNNANVGVVHPSGAACIQKTLDILEKITK